MCSCILRRNSRWLPKWWENDFWTKLPYDSANTLGVKYFIEITLSGTVSKINAAFAIFAELQNGCQNRREKHSARKWNMTLQILWGSKISSKSLNLVPFRRYMHFCFLQINLRWPPKMAEKQNLEKNWQIFLGSKISSKSISHYF